MALRPKLLVLSGPTACGKTAASLGLGEKFGAEIINFDSLCFYRELSIGTAAPTQEEMQRVPHHLVRFQSIAHPINAYDFVALATPLLEDMQARQVIPLLVGGSGFYLQALLRGMYSSQSTPREITQQVEDLFTSQGIEALQEILKKHDPESFQRLHCNDHYRIKRAVEHWLASGTPFSQAKRQFEPTGIAHRWDILHLHLDRDRQEHHRSIKERAQRMLEEGLIEEVKMLLDQGFQGSEKPLQSVGHKQVIDFLQQRISNEEQLLERITIATRQLAKSQRTWFKKLPELIRFHWPRDREKIFTAVSSFLQIKSP